ncbi:MAG: Cys-tRNA(Pro) deacylase [Gammaproteobacteria bacterium]|nr:MAG: Cys-tRNA(Pro) deacylase [Gammaproteobacteria bacterium]
MTPAIQAAKRAGIAFQTHSYDHDPNTPSYGEEAAKKLGVPAGRVFKTLVVACPKGTLAIGIVPVARQLDLKAIARTLGVKKVELARPADVTRATGYVLGGVSPLGQKRRLPTRLDTSARDWPTICVSAGRRGLEIELAPDDLLQLTGGVLADIAG